MDITVSTGTVFKIKKAPSLAFQAVVRQWDAKAPKVPIVYIEDKGRKEENPNDPDYLEAVNKFRAERNLALFDAAILLCTEIVDIPEGMNKPEEAGWIEDLQIIGIAPGEGKRERYLAWVKYYAAPHDEDMEKINTAISRENGVSEGDVTAAMAEFKSAERRGADREVSAQ